MTIKRGNTGQFKYPDPKTRALKPWREELVYEKKGKKFALVKVDGGSVVD